MADPILVVAWLVLAHVVADFVLQTGSIALAKSSHGWRAARGLLAHGLVVAACNVPVALAFGGDRQPVARRLAAHDRHEVPPPPEHLGRAWTPQPAALFLADQAAHLAVIGIAWAMLPPYVALQQGWIDVVNGVLGTHDRAAVHQVVSVAVVLVTLLIVNVRAASLFVGILVRPVEAGIDGDHRWGSRAGPAVDPSMATTATTAQGATG